MQGDAGDDDDDDEECASLVDLSGFGVTDPFLLFSDSFCGIN